jgi:hypothetical protein
MLLPWPVLIKWTIPHLTPAMAAVCEPRKPTAFQRSINGFPTFEQCGPPKVAKPA